MATVKVNGISFYDVAKRKKAERIVDAEEQREKLKAAVFAQQETTQAVATAVKSDGKGPDQQAQQQTK